MAIDNISNIIKSIKIKFDSQDEEFKKNINTEVSTITHDIDSLSQTDLIKNIENVINLLNESYYTLDTPFVSDDIYDYVLDFLEYLDSDNDIFNNIGENNDNKSSSNEFFPSSKHEIIAGSQSKVKKSEADKFEEKISSFNSAITISDKLDGITIVTTYTNDKNKAFEYLEDLFDYHINYINKSNKTLSNKNKLKDYVLSQKSKFISKIKSVSEGNYFPYKIITRGDGVVGDDITLNAIDIQKIVFEINKEELSEYSNIDNFEIIIRSEAVIKLSDFTDLPYKNPRNGIATIRQQNGKNREKITSIPFEKIIHNLNDDTLIYSNKNDMFKWLKKQGFENPYYETFNNIDDMKKAIEKRLADRANDKIDYWIDGLVLSIDKASERLELGMVGKKPKGEFAFKPDPEIAIGEIKEIAFTVGKTGNITPVAQFKSPVQISGSDIEFVSLANENIMKEIAPSVGSIVEVVKRGEIIPKIERNLDLEPINVLIEEFVTKELLQKKLLPKKNKDELYKLYHEGKISKIFNRNISDNLSKSFSYFLKDLLGKEVFDKVLKIDKFKNIFETFISNNSELSNNIISKNIQSQISYPSLCPSCGSTLEKQGEILIKCLSSDCRGKNISQLTFFAQKLTKEIGEGIISQLYDKGILKSYSDFFTISSKDFLNEDGSGYIEGWQESSINIFLNAVKSITNSKDNEFFSSLFFENIGEDKFLKLFQKISFKELHPELDNIEEKIPEEFSEIKTKNKFISELQSINYPYIEIIKKIAEVEGWGAIGIVRFINLWVEEKESLNDLLSVINIIETDLVEDLDEELKVVITGSVDSIPDYMLSANGKSNRDKLKNYLKKLGHKSPSSVSNDTTCLVSDTVSTSGKFKDALDKGVPILTSSEFINKYNNQLIPKNNSKINKNTKDKKGNLKSVV